MVRRHLVKIEGYEGDDGGERHGKVQRAKESEEEGPPAAYQEPGARGQQQKDAAVKGNLHGARGERREL